MREQSLKGRVVTVTRRQPGYKRFKVYGENIKRLVHSLYYKVGYRCFNLTLAS